MPLNQLRRDYLLNRWVVIATERKRRPTDFVQKTVEKARHRSCPFCPGNERMTPPATLVYLPKNSEIVKERDRDEVRHKGWIVRCVPNLYPAFTPLKGGEKPWVFKEPLLAEAVGHHEVIIESPNHYEHPGVARVSQLVHVINACLDRLKTFNEEPYVKYVSIFRNHKLEAGASLSHAHTQMIATPLIPRILEEELKASEEHWARRDECVFCSIIEKEREGPRFIWENDDFLAFAPWASVHPFEFWLFPKRHQSTLLDVDGAEVEGLAEALRLTLGGLNALLNDPPYNYGFHMAPVGNKHERYHWHLEVYPKLATWAGFEKSTGMFINVVPPEDAAANLREAVLAEEKRLSG